MKKEFTITKELLVEMTGWGNSIDNIRIREMYPEAFEDELKTGIWYKSNKRPKLLYFIEEVKDGKYPYQYAELKGYGFGFEGVWLDGEIYPEKEVFCNLTPATTEEIFERLKYEAIKRGFKKGVIVHRPKCFDNSDSPVEIEFDCFKLFGCKRLELGGRSIYENGVWAEIYITKEQAEKELGKKII